MTDKRESGLDATDALPPSEGPENPFGVLPLLMILFLVVCGLFVIFKLRDMASLQDCVSSGRASCAPIELR